MDREKIYVTRSSMPPMEEYFDEIKELWDTHWLTNMGRKHEEFRAQLKDYLEVENVELFTNGHMALELLIQAFEFPEGSEVITTPFTFASTTHAIVRNRLKPVFCDINTIDYTIDVTKIEELITDNTVAILPVHVYGNVCNVEAIDDIAKRYNLKVIYDAAHAFGVKYKGVGICNYGDASMLSFHATKVFNTIEGGAVCYKDKELGKKLYSLKNFGIVDEEHVTSVGANAKMNEFCAAMGICNLRHIDSVIAKRKEVSRFYDDALRDVDGIMTRAEQKDVIANYSYYPILVDKKIYGSNRDDIYEMLLRNCIVTRKYFYPLTSDMECYKMVSYNATLENASNVVKQVLTLPIYEELDLTIVDSICKMLINNAN